MATRRTRSPLLPVLVLVLALVAAACSRSGTGDDDVLTGPDPTTPGQTDGGGPGDAGGAGGDNGGSDGPSTPSGSGGGAGGGGRGGPNGGGGGGGTQTNPPTTRPTSDAAAYAGARGGAGAYARTILRPSPATRVVVEVLQQQGAEPNGATVDRVLRVLRQVTGKTVTLAGPKTIPTQAGDPSEEQVESMSDRYGTVTHGNGQAVIRLLFLKGAFNGEDSILGAAVRGDTAAVMSDQVDSAASPLASRGRIEDAVTQHELGHLLGLVDIVLNTGRADKDHPGHSPNEESVMYWAVESDLVSQALGGPPPVDFDAADLADFAAMRNGA